MLRYLVIFSVTIVLIDMLSARAVTVREIFETDIVGVREIFEADGILEADLCLSNVILVERCIVSGKCLCFSLFKNHVFVISGL